MNSRSLLWICLPALVAACNGGWSEENTSSFRRSCMAQISSLYPQEADSICSCFMEKVTSNLEYSEMSTPKASAMMEECAEPARKKAEQEMRERMNSVLKGEGIIPEINEGDSLDGSR